MPITPRPLPPITEQDRKRFHASYKKVDLGYITLCHQWQSTMFAEGYGSFSFYEPFRNVRAHRVGWAIAKGDTDQHIDHLCHDPVICAGGFTCPHRACVNPDHLKLSPIRENVLRGSGPSANNATKTHCDHGHEFTQENTFFDNGGWRQCRQCRRDRSNRYWNENKEIKLARRRELRGHVVNEPRPCKGCGIMFTPRRSDAKFHDVNCRQRAGYRSRKEKKNES